MASPTPVDQLEGGLYADKSPQLIATTTALLILASLFTGLRFFARWLAGAPYAPDDWAVIVALMATFATGAINYSMIHNGLGRHGAALDFETQEIFFKLLLAFECVYVTGVAIVKLSLLMMYMRIFPTRGIRVTSYIIGGIVVAWWISIVCVCIFQCNPIYKAWQPWLQYGTCIDLKGSFIGNAIPNILTDAMMICMPVFQVWRLQVTLAQKISIIGVFLLGTFVFFASIYRFTTIMQFDVTDTTWTLATACTWCVVETACGLISVCLPTLRPLLSKFSRQFGSVKEISEAKFDSRNTELVTIGGTGGNRDRDRKFTRHIAVEDERFGMSTHIGRSQGGAAMGVSTMEKDGSIEGDAASSGDEVPLKSNKPSAGGNDNGRGIRVHVNRDFDVTETWESRYQASLHSQSEQRKHSDHSVV